MIYCSNELSLDFLARALSAVLSTSDKDVTTTLVKKDTKENNND